MEKKLRHVIGPADILKCKNPEFSMCPEALNHQARLDDVAQGARLLLTSPAEWRPLWEQFM